ncbi:hypothetical protein ACPPVO_54065 [Dactylosporangium sp. McL0621]|uniref:hypothetical protein n=1 Tax=Dactylosporangium sp. McL0621 TaxID=3415678 RepID=UPI003CF6E412
MRESVAVVHDLVSRFSPLDELGAAALAWLASTDDVFRRVKPASPPQHLVSYVVPVAADGRILLVDHVNAGLWLPPPVHSASPLSGCSLSTAARPVASIGTWAAER